ncbi:MAG: hypothetical protein R3A43_13550 [Bacteroidia bacterium]
MKNYFIRLLVLTVILATHVSLSAQMVLTYCEPRGAGYDGDNEVLVDASGNKYQLIMTQDPNYPVTSGTSPGGDVNLVLEKYDASNNLVFSKYLIGGNGNDRLTDLYINYNDRFILANNKLYICGNTTSTNFYTTDGSTYKGNIDAFLQVYDLSGNLLLSKLIGTSYLDYSPHLQVDTDDIYVIFNEADFAGLPVSTGGQAYSAGGDIYYARYSQTGTLKYATYIGGSGGEFSIGSTCIMINF